MKVLILHGYGNGGLELIRLYVHESRAVLIALEGLLNLILT